MAGSGGSVTKAVFKAENGVTLTVQFNPTQFQFNKASEWKEHDRAGLDSDLEFQSNKPATISMELYFDSTHDGMGDVRSKWVNTLLAMTNPSVKPKDGEAADMDKKRPPKVTFLWGRFSMIGVLTKVDATYMMFSSDGLPVRAKVSVEMKEWVMNPYSAGGGGGQLSTTPVQLVTVGAGETVSAVAMRSGMSTKEFCEANNIDDPTADHTGAQYAAIG
jgi:hypothetical protein